MMSRELEGILKAGFEARMACVVAELPHMRLGDRLYWCCAGFAEIVLACARIEEAGGVAVAPDALKLSAVVWPAEDNDKALTHRLASVGRELRAGDYGRMPDFSMWTYFKLLAGLALDALARTRPTPGVSRAQKKLPMLTAFLEKPPAHLDHAGFHGDALLRLYDFAGDLNVIAREYEVIENPPPAAEAPLGGTRSVASTAPSVPRASERTRRWVWETWRRCQAHPEGLATPVEGRKVYVRDAWEATTEAERAKFNVHTLADFTRIKQSMQRTLNRKG